MKTIEGLNIDLIMAIDIILNGQMKSAMMLTSLKR